MRSRYSDILSVEYSKDDIYIRSTSVDRALMSAAANLAGLYPPNKVQQWNNNVGKLWQPIPIHSIPMDYDSVHFISNMYFLGAKFFISTFHLLILYFIV